MIQIENGDLISRKALLEVYDAAHKGPPGGARKLIEQAPSIEAEPKSGRWIDKWPEVECSVCGREWFNATTDNEPSQFHYCPNCGAKMDLEG